jgi:3',5'-cyclic AMP phosphodiesterase CpdA
MPDEARRHAKTVIWQLSDFHVKAEDIPGEAPQQGNGETGPQRQPAENKLPPWQELLDCVKRYKVVESWRQNFQPDFVVICGDLVDQGNKDQAIRRKMSHARRFVDDLRRELDRSTKFVIVPGNHDIYRSYDDVNYDAQSKFSVFDGEFNKDEDDFLTPTKSQYPGVRLYDDLGVLFCAFNSAASHGGVLLQDYCTLSRALNYEPGRIRGNSAVEQALERMSHRDGGWIDWDHMNEAEKQVREILKEKTVGVRIAVAHHCPGGVGQPETAAFSSICNSGAFISWLVNNEFHLFLHGHKHQATRDRIEEPVLAHRRPWLGLPGVHCAGTHKVARHPEFGFNIVWIDRHGKEPLVEVKVISTIDHDLAQVDPIGPLYELPSPAYIAFMDHLPTIARESVGTLLDELMDKSSDRYFRELLEEGGILADTLQRWSNILTGFAKRTESVEAQAPVMATYKDILLKTLQEALELHRSEQHELHRSQRQEDKGRDAPDEKKTLAAEIQPMEVRMTTYWPLQFSRPGERNQREAECIDGFVTALREYGSQIEVHNLVVVDAKMAKKQRSRYLRDIWTKRHGPPFELRWIERGGESKVDYHIWGKHSFVCINNVDRAARVRHERLHVLTVEHRETIEWLRESFQKQWDAANQLENTLVSAGHESAAR